ncbi:hypothetical protein PAMA_013615 [Pampus argenteus]
MYIHLCLIQLSASVSLVINVLMVAQVPHSYCSQKDDAAFPHIVPNRRQFFEYESISVNCEFDGSSKWRVKRTLKEKSPTKWATSETPATITGAFSSDSGEYWCEDGEGLRSNAVNISVTAGSVILESPVLPPKQGDSLTLHCKVKHTSDIDVIADFYKNGLLVNTVYEGDLTIHNISTSNEGLYKCNVSGAGESPESWLTVRESHDESTPSTPTTPTPPPSSGVVWLVVSVLCVSLLLLVLGVLCYRKHKSTQEVTEGSANRGADSEIDPYSVTFVGENQKKAFPPHVPTITAINVHYYQGNRSLRHSC